MSNEEKLKEAQEKLVKLAVSLLSEMKRPVLYALHDQQDPQDEHPSYVEIEVIAEIMVEQYRHWIVCGRPTSEVMVKMAQTVHNGYSWLSNNVEFMLREEDM